MSDCSEDCDGLSYLDNVHATSEPPSTTNIFSKFLVEQEEYTYAENPFDELIKVAEEFQKSMPNYIWDHVPFEDTAAQYEDNFYEVVSTAGFAKLWNHFNLDEEPVADPVPPFVDSCDEFQYVEFDGSQPEFESTLADLVESFVGEDTIELEESVQQLGNANSFKSVMFPKLQDENFREDFVNTVKDQYPPGSTLGLDFNQKIMYVVSSEAGLPNLESVYDYFNRNGCLPPLNNSWGLKEHVKASLNLLYSRRPNRQGSVARKTNTISQAKPRNRRRRKNKSTSTAGRGNNMSYRDRGGDKIMFRMFRGRPLPDEPWAWGRGSVVAIEPDPHASKSQLMQGRDGAKWRLINGECKSYLTAWKKQMPQMLKSLGEAIFFKDFVRMGDFLLWYAQREGWSIPPISPALYAVLFTLDSPLGVYVEQRQGKLVIVIDPSCY
jgi:hypothetical protein